MPKSITPQNASYTLRPAIPSDIPFLAAIERSAGQLFRTVGLDSVADDPPMPVEVLEGYLFQGNLWVACIDDTTVRNGVGKEESTTVGKGEVVVGFLAAFPLTATGNGASVNNGNEQRRRGEDGPEQGNPGKKQRRPEQNNEQQNLSTQLIHIAELSIHASHHRRGLGTRLLKYFENDIRTRIKIHNTTSIKSPSPDAHITSQDPRITALSLTTYAPLAFNGRFYRAQGFVDVEPEKILEVVGRRGRELWEEEQRKIVRPEWRCWMVKWL